MNINDKINQLPEVKRAEFLRELDECVNHGTWLSTHGLDYVNPDVERAKEILYDELYESLIRGSPKHSSQQSAAQQE